MIKNLRTQLQKMFELVLVLFFKNILFKDIFKDCSIPQTTQQNPCFGKISEHFASESDPGPDAVRPALYWENPLNNQH